MYSQTKLFRKNTYVFLALFSTQIFANALVYSQTGPGGVGETDGSTNLSLWLDANTITGVADGANMGSWLDQSGNGYNALVGTAPNYSATGGGNGMPAVTFDASNSEYLYIPTNAEVMPTNEISVFVVANMENGSDDWASVVSAYDDDAANDGWSFERNNGSNNVEYYVDGWGNGCSRTITYGQNDIFNIVFNTSDNQVYSYLSENVCTDNFNGPINYNGGANDDVLIGTGTDNGGPAYFLEGDIQEVIIFDVAVNNAQRIIIANYLSAKYAINLNNNDSYAQDDNGNFDFEVAGIGRTDASNIHDESQGTGIVRMLNPGDLDNNEFLIWGHDNGVEYATELGDVPSGGDPVYARFDRVWRVSEANAAGSAAVDVGSVDIRFDLTGKGPVTPAHLRLLVDTDNDGVFSDETPISGATLVSGNIYQFAGVTALTNNTRFTLGTTHTATPLPVELIHFDVWRNNGKADLVWETGSEIDFSHFEIEKSKDGRTFVKIADIIGQGTSNVVTHYQFTDMSADNDVNYYRLREVDLNGSWDFSHVVAISALHSENDPKLTLYPNPNKGRNLEMIVEGIHGDDVNIRVFDALGRSILHRQVRLVHGKTHISVVFNGQLPHGTYHVQAISRNMHSSEVIVVQ